MLRPFLPPVAALLATVCAAFAQQKPPAPAPPLPQLTLVRYDLPRGLADGYAPTRQTAQRRGGADAIDWPSFTLNGQPIWKDSAEAALPLRLRTGEEARSPFRQPTDDVLEPGGHWLRFMEWPRGRTHLYTADRTARTANTAARGTGRYELWTFPIVIKGEGGPVVKNVELHYDGKPIYRQAGPWRSLTLLLPANPRGHQYELKVDGRGPVKFDAGLMPVKVGDPHERVIALNVALPGDGPKLTLQNLARPEHFPHQREWDADVAALRQPVPGAARPGRGETIERYLGVEVPRSPFTIYASGLPRGMSGGFFRKGENVEDYAAFLADTGYDVIFEPVTVLPPAAEAESLEARASALVRRGLKLGLHYDNNWNRPSIQHPNFAFLAHHIPEWHAPLYRSVSLAAQRFARLPNFAGLNVGADCAGYASMWPSAPPIPDRPWGEAMLEFSGSAAPVVPRGPSLGAPELPFEKPSATQGEFIKYVQRYELTFRQYGYLAEAVREVSPGLTFTTAAFGSAAPGGSRGGWPWGSVSGRAMFDGLTTQQAHDLNDTHAAKPLHNVALTDRLVSYNPRAKTWSLLDNFRFLYGREAWQRACALALTRGIQGLGTNFIASPTGDGARPETVAWQREMYTAIRRLGGVFARTEPVPEIGIFFSHHQAVCRPVLTGENPSAEQLLRGSHEGKVTEALFIAHAAGCSARIVTFQEMMRGPLPPSMKALLLVGLENYDDSWNWAEGLEPALQQFVARGGKLLADETSYVPLPAVPTGLKVAAYVAATNLDPTPLLFARNRDNIARLRTALEGLAAPLASSDDPRVWTIPTECGDTKYLTAIWQGYAEGAEAAEMLLPADPKATRPETWKTKANASLYVPPGKGTLRWQTERPIYDVRLGRRLTGAEAATADFSRDSFRWYALPPAEVVTPEVAIAPGVSGFFEARPTMKNGRRLDGVPVQVTVERGSERATVFGATGQVIRLPVNARTESGDFTVTTTELLSGLQCTQTIHSPGQPLKTEPTPVAIREPVALAKFAGRKHVALIVALTPEQEKNATIAAQARALAQYYRQQGRVVTRQGVVTPGGIVESLQVLRSPHRFPQWQTVPADLVLFGTAADNVLLLDQARGEILPQAAAKPKPGAASIVYTRSPFRGEFDVVNVIAGDAAGITAAVEALMASARTAVR